MVCIGVGEHNLHTTRRHTRPSPRTLTPVVIPAAHHFNGKLIHVVIVFMSRLTPIERSVTFLMIRIAILVPILTKTLVTTVLHSPHRVLLRLIDIQHLTTILRLVNVEHLAAAYGPATIRIILVTNGFHLQHVFTTDALVATLIEDDRRIIAIIDDGITHQVGTLLPARALHIFLCITGRHSLQQSYPVARLYILLPWSDVHPAYQIASRLYHQVVGVVAKPRRNGESHSRPLVAGALGIAMHHQTAIVKPYLSFAKTGLAETRTDNYFVITGTQVQRFVVCPILCQIAFDSIEITIAPRPEMQSAQLLQDADSTYLTRLQMSVLPAYTSNG